jgi:LAO/AO transport system kinase
MADQSLAQRLLAGDKRALARGITLVESDDPAGWELVREVYPRPGARPSSGSPARPAPASRR